MSLRKHLYYLSESIGSRLIGTPGNQQAQQYIAGVLGELGCTLNSQQFGRTISIPSSGYVKEGAGGSRLECWPCLGTPRFGPEKCSVKDVGFGRRGDWELVNVSGHAALCKRGELHESVKVDLAARKGAKAVLFYVDFEDCLYASRASSRVADIPAAVIRPSLARRLSHPASNAIELSLSASLADVECVNLWCDFGSTKEGLHCALCPLRLSTLYGRSKRQCLWGGLFVGACAPALISEPQKQISVHFF